MQGDSALAPRQRLLLFLLMIFFVFLELGFLFESSFSITRRVVIFSRQCVGVTSTKWQPIAIALADAELELSFYDTTEFCCARAASNGGLRSQ